MLWARPRLTIGEAMCDEARQTRLHLIVPARLRMGLEKSARPMAETSTTRNTTLTPRMVLTTARLVVSLLLGITRHDETRASRTPRISLKTRAPASRKTSNAPSRRHFSNRSRCALTCVLEAAVKPPGMSSYDRYPSFTLPPDTTTHNTGFNTIIRRSDKISSSLFSGVRWCSLAKAFLCSPTLTLVVRSYNVRARFDVAKHSTRIWIGQRTHISPLHARRGYSRRS